MKKLKLTKRRKGYIIYAVIQMVLAAILTPYLTGAPKNLFFRYIVANGLSCFIIMVLLAITLIIKNIVDSIVDKEY